MNKQIVTTEDSLKSNPLEDSLLFDETIDEMPPMIKLIYECCGKHITLALILRMPGMSIYVPSSSIKIIKASEIAENFTGKNTAALSVRYGLTMAKVRLLAKQKENKDYLCNESIKMVSETCGENAANALCRHFPGQTIYVSGRGIKALQRKYIEKMFCVTSTMRLALQLGVSERFVHQTVHNYYENRKTRHQNLNKDCQCVTMK